MSGPDLHLEVVDDEIIVTMSGTSYAVTYYKPTNSPQLLAKDIADRDDSRTAMRLSEFLARAWKLANDKAYAANASRPNRRDRSAIKGACLARCEWSCQPHL